MIHYLDTSAALKLLIAEAESEALAADLERSLSIGDSLVASWLLFTELHCAAGRRQSIPAESVNGVLDAVTLIDVERDDLLRAGTSAWGLRSADALHLATAIRVQADDIVSFDVELVAAANRVGIPDSRLGRIG